MSCHLVLAETVVELLTAGGRRQTFEQILTGPNGQLAVAYAAGAHAVLLQRVGGGRVFEVGTYFNAEWVQEMLTTAVRDGRRYAQPADIMRWVYRMGKSPMETHAFLTGLEQVTHAATSNHVQGALFVWRWLDDWRLWNIVEGFEVVVVGQSHRAYDVVLAGGRRFEMKDWAPVSAANLRRYAGDQMLNDLANGPLTNTFWVFSENLIPTGSAPPTPAAFRTWLETEIDTLVASAATRTPPHANLPAIQANWATLRGNGIETRVMVHDPAVAQQVGGSVDTTAELYEALNTWAQAHGVHAP